MRERCRREYSRLYALDARRVTPLKRVVELHQVEDRPRAVTAELDCGHRWTLPRSLLRKRMRCHVCEEDQQDLDVAEKRS